MYTICKNQDEYTEWDRTFDMFYFEDHYQEFYEKYGLCSLAIRHQEVIGTGTNVRDLLIEFDAKGLPVGTYSVQTIKAEKYTVAYIPYAKPVEVNGGTLNVSQARSIYDEFFKQNK